MANLGAVDLFRAGFRRLKAGKRFILKRLLIYFIILLAAFPVVFMFRNEIYSTLLVRYDDWYVRVGENGIPVGEYGYQKNVYVGPQTTARIVANAATGYYNQAMDGNETAAEYFNNTVDWLMENIDYFTVPFDSGTLDIAHWIYDFAIWDYPAGWYQAMADAKGMYVFALAYNLTGDSSYLDNIELLLNSFEVPIAQGGNLYVLDDGGSWYPEYIVPGNIDPDFKPILILNGFLICLNNLHRASVVLNDTAIYDVFNEGMLAAAQNLYKYDSPYNWTLYHLGYPQKLASRLYHQIHINEVAYLYEHTNVTVFGYYLERWESYTGPPAITIEEILSPEFIYYGLVMVSIVLVPVVTIDFVQYGVRHYLRRNKEEKERE